MKWATEDSDFYQEMKTMMQILDISVQKLSGLVTFESQEWAEGRGTLLKCS
jgi:hypothetical protein